MKQGNAGVISRTFFRLLPVQIIMVAVSSVNAVIDGIAATNFIGPMALAATALFFPVIKLMDTLNTTLLGGSQILCGQYMGKNMRNRSISVFSLDMVCVVLFGFLLSVLVTAFCRPLSGLLVQDAGLLEDLCEYMKGYAPGLIAYLLIPQLTAFLQIEQQDKRIYLGMGAMILTNCGLDVWFTAGLKMGMFGLGLATTLSNLVYVVILISYYFTGKAVIRFSVKELDPKDFLPILRIGAPGAVGQLGQAVRGTLLNMIMLTFVGETGVAAFGAVSTLGGMYYAATAGVASATRLLASVYVGEEDRTGLLDIMKTAVYKGVGMVAGLAVLFMVLSGILTGFFYGPEAGEVYGMTRLGFLLFPLSMPFSCFCCVFSNYFQCREQMGIVNLLSLTDGVLGVGLFSILLAPILGMTGVWMAQILGGVLTNVLVIAYARKKQKAWPRNVESLLVLDRDFGVAEEDRIDLTVRNMEEVLQLSEKVMEFCTGHGVEHKRALYAGLCVEEMAGNIVDHGFASGKTHCIDIRVLYRENELLLRLKDDCRPFNPKQVKELFDPQDVTRNLGLRMVAGMAKSIRYQNSFGLNVLTITV